MNRCVIIGGAAIGDYYRVRARLRPDDYAVYCDCGLNHASGLGRAPDLIVGDFDSHPAPEAGAEIITLPREKDDTDTVYAVKEALRRGFEEFLLLGVIGGRLDHTLANISILLMLDTLGKKASALDDYGEFSVVSRGPAYVSDRYPFFSLLNIDGLARDVSIRGAKYPLTGAEITCEYQYGVSNQVLPGQWAEITVGEGRLLLMKVADGDA